MNTFELQHRFDLEVAKFGVTDPILTVIVEDHLNYAYQQFITEKYDSLINPVEKFEITERISRILAPLLDDFNTSTFVSITTNSPYGFYCVAPVTLQYIIKEAAVVNTVDCDGNPITTRVRIKPMRHNLISSNLDNPFLKPDDSEIWRVNYSENKVELILSNIQTLQSYTCRFIKKQIPINLTTGVTMEIDSSVHEEVAVKAAYLYLGNLTNNTKKKENV